MSKELLKDVSGELVAPVNAFPHQQGYYAIENGFKRLSGKVLTVIDAVIADKQQNKAVKDLIKQEFRETMYDFQNRCSDGKTAHSINL